MMRRSIGAVGPVQVVAVAAIAVAGATLVAWAIETSLGIDDASVVYIVAVAATAVLAGTPGAVAASIGAFLTYDFLFIEPRYTFTIRDPQEWLTLLLLLFVAIVVGQLAALQRRQTQTALEREHEARELFRVSRALAARTSTAEAMRRILDEVVAATVATRAWVEILDEAGLGRVVADTDQGSPRPAPASIHVLRRTGPDEPPVWSQVHVATRPAGRGTAADDGGGVTHRVSMDVGGRRIGMVTVLVPRDRGRPGHTDTRLFAAVADQLAQALEQDRLAAENRQAEIAREGDRIKTALLETVSHDLRTPLAAIRAAAGMLLDRTVTLGQEDRYAVAEAIDRDADRLNRIVTNLLDLSRVEGGALRPELDGYDLRDLVETALDRARPRLGGRPIREDLAELPPVRVDPTFLGQILDNLFENVARYAGDGTELAVTGATVGDAVRLTVEDGGAGVPDEALPRLFDKFYRVPGRGASSKGSGVGMAVVRGFAEAMEGRVTARRSRLGGLAVDVELPVAPVAEHTPPPAPAAPGGQPTP